MRESFCARLNNSWRNNASFWLPRCGRCWIRIWSNMRSRSSPRCSGNRPTLTIAFLPLIALSEWATAVDLPLPTGPVSVTTASVPDSAFLTPDRIPAV